ncbi:MAG: hypothetical protein HFH73_02680 [Lachnospiraceae bacterium]|nr:hypothetical protein [Lachnospiraceae bacterium]
MGKNMKLFFCLILFFSFVVLTAALSITVAKMKEENKELKIHYSSTFSNQSKEIEKKEKILSDRKKAAELVKSFIPAFFLSDKTNYEENRKKIKDVVSAELYNKLKDEEFEASDYETEIVSAPVYALADGEQASGYKCCSIISLQYRAGAKDYGIHMQIWNFSCGYYNGEMRILRIEQQKYIE